MVRLLFRRLRRTADPGAAQEQRRGADQPTLSGVSRLGIKREPKQDPHDDNHNHDQSDFCFPAQIAPRADTRALPAQGPPLVTYC